MNKQFIYVFIFLMIIIPVSAEFVGTSKINEKMQITNYCDSGNCTFVTLQTLEYPNGTVIYLNENMTKRGQSFNYTFIPDQFGTYTFVTCGLGFSIVSVCDKDTFFVNYSGEDNSILSLITLLVFFISLFIGYYNLNNRINYDKWYDGILKKYEGKNYVKLALSSVGYNLIKNKIGVYYILGFPIILILVDIVTSYQVVTLITLFENLLFVYSLGVVIIAFLFFGMLQEFIKGLIDDITDDSWGIQR